MNLDLVDEIAKRIFERLLYEEYICFDKYESIDEQDEENLSARVEEIIKEILYDILCNEDWAVFAYCLIIGKRIFGEPRWITQQKWSRFLQM